jgi:hypothetical protein
MPSGNPKAVEDRLIKANELARKAMQFAATGVNIKKAVERFIVELEARKDIPPKMLYGVFNLVAPYDQSVRSSALLWMLMRSHPLSIHRCMSSACGYSSSLPTFIFL